MITLSFGYAVASSNHSSWTVAKKALAIGYLALMDVSIVMMLTTCAHAH